MPTYTGSGCPEAASRSRSPSRLPSRDLGDRRDAAEELVVVGHFLDPLGADAPAAQHVGQKRADVVEPLRTAERDDQDGVKTQKSSLQ